MPIEADDERRDSDLFTKVYLVLNSVIYLALAGWCTVSPTKTAAALGFTFESNSAKAEYLVVYGGLELALGIMFVSWARKTELHRSACVFAVTLYGALAGYRLLCGVTLTDLDSMTYTMLAVEIALFSLALVALKRQRSARYRPSSSSSLG